MLTELGNFSIRPDCHAFEHIRGGKLFALFKVERPYTWRVVFRYFLLIHD